MPTHCGQQGRALSCVGRRAYALGVGAAAPPNRCPHRGRPRSPLSPQSQGFHPQGHLTAGLLSMSPPHPAVWAPHHCTDGQGACASWQPESIILPSPAPSPGLLQVSEGGGDTPAALGTASLLLASAPHHSTMSYAGRKWYKSHLIRKELSCNLVL